MLQLLKLTEIHRSDSTFFEHQYLSQSCESSHGTIKTGVLLGSKNMCIQYLTVTMQDDGVSRVCDRLCHNSILPTSITQPKYVRFKNGLHHSILRPLVTYSYIGTESKWSTLERGIDKRVWAF